MTRDSFTDFDRAMMARALQLAALGRGHVSPNPMVGAVITAPDGRIIGEGWHRRYGGPHAEVNAVRSVAEDDKHLLPQSTIYVTLEPCSHYGKTPPCAKLLVDISIGRVVVGADDPNPKVAGRGLAMLRDADIEVHTGLMAAESEALNRTFMLSQRLRRPFVTLKWACSADGYMDSVRADGEGAYRFSTTLSAQLVHRRRADHDAIAVGAGTVIADAPRLDVRHIAGRSPQRVVFDRHGIVADRVQPEDVHISDARTLAEVLHSLFADRGISSLLVEGGASLLRSFIAAGLWDEAYVEVAPVILGVRGTTPAPTLPVQPVSAHRLGPNTIFEYRRF